MYKFVSKDVKSDAVAFSWFNAKTSYFKALFVYVFVTIAACVSIFSDIKDWKNIILVILMLLGGVVFVLVHNLIRKAPLKNNYINKTKEIRITFDENKVSSETVYDDGEAKGECDYKRFIKIREDKNRIYCYLETNSALILNKKSVDDIDAFRVFLKGKVNRGV